jgi:protoporphyrinogen oxidase
VKTGILGGGLTALTLASSLKDDHEILEKNERVGGLCRSFSEKGFTFDIGGHIFYSKEQPIMDWMLGQLGENKHQKRRNNKVLVKGRYIKYPFENELSGLPLKDNLYCLFTYLFNPYTKQEPLNFKEWLYYTFGKGISELYLVPYNEKIWKYPLENMSLHWVAGRVPKPPQADVIKSSLGISTEGYTHQLYFHYPKTGGIQALIDSLEKKAGRIGRGFSISSVRKVADKWVVSNGTRKKVYDRLVSTIPVPELINALDKVPKEIRQAASKLRYNSIITVFIGLNIPELNPYTALYVPSKEIEPNRLCFMNNFSEHNAPKGCFGVMTETTIHSDKLEKETDEELATRTIEGLHRLGILNKDEIIYTKVFREKYAYVVYDIDYQKNIKILRDYLEQRGILLCGRFGEFEYLNMDACVKRALELGKRLNDENTGITD